MRALPHGACTFRTIVRQAEKTRTVAVIRFAQPARPAAIGVARRDAIRHASTSSAYATGSTGV
ncbi:hypothetical protein CUJ89_29690 [Burkholderia pyrrocinia]|uniref:Uncharacterized protein n=1 Tax=Burkholderia pyrrocinia TaxID=60550 RepID=A0A2Z5N5R7_BURPY|nr:hypothetical protein CUJ89_29690 [Burkholderia pyrrocinia]